MHKALGGLNKNPINSMNIGQAAEALKAGKRARCQEWPPEKKFVFVQVPSTIKSEIVPKMQSLPDSVKAYFNETFESESDQINAIYYTNQIAIVGPSNLIESYSPTCADILSESWVILD